MQATRRHSSTCVKSVCLFLAAIAVIFGLTRGVRADDLMKAGIDWRAASRFVDAEPSQIMDRVVRRAREAVSNHERPVVVFDLDSTLYNNGPRNVQIAHEYAEAHRADANAQRIGTLQSKNVSFSLAAMLGSCGIDIATDAGKASLADYKSFWTERFFDNKHVTYDEIYPSAAANVVRVFHATDSAPAEVQLVVVYLTGRHYASSMGKFPAGMEKGTRADILRDGLPLDDKRAVLIMKDAFGQNDAQFKRAATEKIRSLGHVVATFDNEPGNVSVLTAAFQDAVNVWVRTIDSGAPAPPVRGVYAIGGGSNDLAGWPSVLSKQ